MFLYHASNFFERCLSCAHSNVHIHIMMDDVYIYHAHNFFGLCVFCVGPHTYSSTSQTHELTKRALESNDDLGSHGLSFPPLSSRKGFAHFFYITSLGYGLLSITYYMPILPCSLCMICSFLCLCHAFCDPCFALHMMIDSHTCMCICKLGGDITCYCHDAFVPHAYYDALILLCVRACDMSCVLHIPTICSHDMIAMPSPSVLHLRSTSLHDLITMLASCNASPMIHT